jgi:hypothetical protein
MTAPNPAMQPWNDNMDTHIIVARMYAERQRHSIAAAVMAGPQEPPWHPAPFLHSGVVTGTMAPTTLSAVPTGGPETVEPPKVAEFLLNMCATSIRDESEWGCMRERFTTNWTELGHRRAIRLYWAHTLGYLLRQRDIF